MTFSFVFTLSIVNSCAFAWYPLSALTSKHTQEQDHYAIEIPAQIVVRTYMKRADLHLRHVRIDQAAGRRCTAGDNGDRRDNILFVLRSGVSSSSKPISRLSLAYIVLRPLSTYSRGGCTCSLCLRPFLGVYTRRLSGIRNRPGAVTVVLRCEFNSCACLRIPHTCWIATNGFKNLVDFRWILR